MNEARFPNGSGELVTLDQIARTEPPSEVTLHEVVYCGESFWTDWPDYDSSYVATGRTQKYALTGNTGE
jgi:hypothetical protein